MTIKKKDLINEAIKVTRSYNQKMTLRQVYYRLVAKQIIENNISQYKRLSSVLVYARQNGLMRPNALDERHRDKARITTTGIDDPIEHLELYARSLLRCDKAYTIPRWQDQEERVIISLEKDALKGIFGREATRLDIGLIVGKGYNSYTQLWDLSRKIRDHLDDVDPIILCFGDFDPTGKDIIRSFKERLEEMGVRGTFKTIALTQEQILEHNLPPAPTKASDSRSAKFVERYGDRAVELDALEPPVLEAMIRDEVAKYFDESIYQDTRDLETEQRALIKKAITKIDDLLDFDNIIEELDD